MKQEGMKHLDLFSGIGGFALATEMVWDNVEHTFCDNEPFNQAVLKKHWPNATIYGDIRTLTTNAASAGFQYSKNQKRNPPGMEETQSSGHKRYDLLTGGFPCQPFSQAGRRRGTEDDRHLWPEMLRVIREFHPRWVIGENVGGLVTWSEGLVLEQIHADLEGEGYEVQAFIIPAVAVNAPHRRDRIWIVANTTSERGRERAVETQRTWDEAKQKWCGMDAENARPDWAQNWTEVAARLCRVDDGVPRRLDRNPRLKALGNAIVPQVAVEIMNVIKEVDF